MKAPVMLAGAAVFAVACSESPRIIAPAASAKPGLEIADASTGLGNRHFYWLPPTYLVAPSYSGTFDPAVAPTVTICEWTEFRCGATVAHFSLSEGTGRAPLTVNTIAESYSANWDTRQCDVASACPLDPAKQYRVIVSVQSLTGSTIELGHADIDVVAKMPGVFLVDRTQYVPLVEDRKFPIAFRLETGIVAGVRVTPASVSVEACHATQLVAEVQDLHGQALSGRSVYWSSADPSVVSVDGNGLVSAQGNGSTTLYATAEGVTGTAGAIGMMTPRIAFMRVPAGGFGSTQIVIMADCGAGQTYVTPVSQQNFDPEWSPDGVTLFYWGYHGPGGSGFADIYANRPLGGSERNLTNTQNVNEIISVWSPIQTNLGILYNRNASSTWDVWRMNTDGTGQMPVLTGTFNFSASPDGQQIAYESNCGVRVSNIDGTNDRQLIPGDCSSRLPVWSPDGARVALITQRKLHVVRPDGSGLVPLSPEAAVIGSSPAHFSWSPDGRQVAYRQDIGVYSPLDGSGPVTYVGDVVIANADGSGSIDVGGTRGSDRPTWTPDGRVLFTRGSRPSEYHEIMLMNSDGTAQTRLTTGYWDQEPRWRP